MSQNPIRILVADDHTLLREALCDLLRAEPDFEIVGQAGTGTAALRLAVEHNPDVLLLDLEMPESNPPETVRLLLAHDPALRIIVLSMHDAQQLVQQLLSLGVRGYLHKGAGRQTLVSAIRQSVGDGPQTVTLSVSPESLRARAEEQEDPSTLSSREREVLVLVAEALSNRQIATRLGVTEATVKRHLRNIFTKLEAVSRIDAVNRAVERALISRQRSGSPEGARIWR
ncbi:DNA-binding NarL/FixJ family response regulator [Nocardia transvalensis]|uniref:DNA-binding NarL/FixJ family response regulator n=1 Tax=Nocardia transvalensis TaxID=37333 RepID=A0A7W9UGZ1_9NOCA|nr:response regulator transcription factor [Nocardia transvalensis]MBB5912165.1 DNA-binding NarL/FixJ family response regulator [Nocardia transvalensis]